MKTDLIVTRQGALFMGRRFPCAIGRGGITPRKREGDGATPLGVHGFIGLMYRPDRVARGALPGWAVPIRRSDGWSDDPQMQDYNHITRLPYAGSHERMWRRDRLYDVVLLTDWNWPVAAPGHGSAIFVHCWRGPRVPTAGCVAFDPADLLWITRRLRHQSRLIIRG